MCLAWLPAQAAMEEAVALPPDTVPMRELTPGSCPGMLFRRHIRNVTEKYMEQGRPREARLLHQQ